ncbi:hypothetical protein [Microbulbifer celer]|uniref:Uncharacterized protein n=1 Tax=Microbulbifer celer TaxID=435905 RepID=A0ABW3U515_9GAMM|nr:hypothetical protein [Microbulbifer celer]UFN56757.1 hypothetical protein LPW13_14445 [Microbulbifer celer]
MKIDNSQLNLFEELSEDFRFFIVKNLKDCLKNTDLPDSDKEEICGEFLAELCANLDQGEWENNGKYYRPVVGFIDSKSLQSWDSETRFIIPYQAYHHHDKVWDEIEDMYENA